LNIPNRVLISAALLSAAGAVCHAARSVDPDHDGWNLGQAGALGDKMRRSQGGPTDG